MNDGATGATAPSRNSASASAADVEREQLRPLLVGRALDPRADRRQQRAVGRAGAEHVERVEQGDREGAPVDVADAVLLGRLVGAAGGERDVRRRAAPASASSAPAMNSVDGRAAASADDDVAVGRRRRRRAAASTPAAGRTGRGCHHRSGSSRGSSRRGRRAPRPRRSAGDSSLSASARRSLPSMRRPQSWSTIVWIRPLGSRSAIAAGAGSSLPWPQ